MSQFDRKKHWENIYETKSPEEVSWYQPVPHTSLEFINHFNVPKTAKIIDVGGGDSFLVDHLLELGYEDITVLDISAAAIERAKARLGEKAVQVHWIVSDAAGFQPTRTYDFWHDRATFHFLTDEKDIASYLTTIRQSLSADGTLVIGTFSDKGPEKCSGIRIKQYSADSMSHLLGQYGFKKIYCITTDHVTPSGAKQHFTFCGFG